MIREGIKSDLTLYTKIYIERVENKDIIIVKVSEAPNKPYYLSDKGLKSSGVYLRHGNVSVQANEEVVKRLLIESNSNTFKNNVSKVQDLHFEYLKKNNKINRLIVESLLDVSKTRANDILNKMINDNILIQNGTGKNTYYVLK